MSNFIDICKAIRDGETVGASGKMAKFTVVVRSPMKNKDTGEYGSTFVDVICFNKQIDSALQVKKGDYVGVVGSIEMNKYTNKDGIEKQTLQVIADQVKPMAFNSKKEDHAPAASNFVPQESAPTFLVPDDTECSLPFDL